MICASLSSRLSPYAMPPGLQPVIVSGGPLRSGRVESRVLADCFPARPVHAFLKNSPTLQRNRAIPPVKQRRFGAMLRQGPSIAMEIYPSVQKITEVCFSVLPIAPSPQRTLLLRSDSRSDSLRRASWHGMEYPVDPRILAVETGDGCRPSD